MNTKSEFLRTWQVFLTRSFLFFVLNTDSYTRHVAVLSGAKTKLLHIHAWTNQNTQKEIIIKKT